MKYEREVINQNDWCYVVPKFSHKEIRNTGDGLLLLDFYSKIIGTKMLIGTKENSHSCTFFVLKNHYRCRNSCTKQCYGDLCPEIFVSVSFIFFLTVVFFGGKVKKRNAWFHNKPPHLTAKTNNLTEGLQCPLIVSGLTWASHIPLYLRTVK